jgi:2-desacetyl-2-hydroxyethyl bacteriochlorophyllide A dehydrogenase
MKALHYLGEQHLEIVDIPKPEVGPDEVLLKIKKVGICGTDLHIYRGHLDVPIPLVQGHEFVGDVVEVGSNVTDVKVGDRVTAEHVLPSASSPFPRNIAPNPIVIGLQRQGALAEYMSVPASLVSVLPQELSYDDGVLVEPLSIAVYAVRRSKVRVGDRVVVLGQGPIGLFLDAVLKAAGAYVVGVDLNETRLGFAKEHGYADEVVNSVNCDGVSCLLPLGMTYGADVTFEAVGIESTLKMAIDLCKPRGQVVLLGVFGKPVQIDMMRIVKREIEVIASWRCLDTFGYTIDLLKTKKIRTDGFITHRYAFEDVIKAFEDSAMYSDGRIKTVIEFF